jgi:hypothetical protein
MANEPVFFNSVVDIRKAYENGFIGASCDPERTAALKAMIAADGGVPEGAAACSQFGLEETGKNKLTLLFREIYALYPDCLPGGAQGRGDCVSWSTRNACLGTMCAEITSAKPDEVTGKLEGAPEVSARGIASGVLSTEAFYNFRGHSGDGWFCSDAAQVAIKKSGLWLRKDYPEIGLDLTEYSSRNAGKYGGNAPPASWLAVGKNHLLRTATVLHSFEELRDMLANGYAVSSCGSEGFSDQRDVNGVSLRKGSWAHAMAYLACDDRPEIHKLYGGPLVMLQQSWGDWNEGGKRIFGTFIDMPTGAFWVKWSDIKNRDMIAFSGVNGWPRKKLKSYGALGNI